MLFDSKSDIICGVISIFILLTVQNIPRIIELIGAKCKLTATPEKRKSFETVLSLSRFICACKNIFLFILSTGIAYGMYTSNDGKIQLSLVGHIKKGMPDLAVPPTRIVNVTEVNGTLVSEVIVDRPTMLTGLMVGFIIIPLMITMEQFAVLKSLSAKSGYKVVARQELLALGFGNIITAFLGGMPITGAITRFALNDQCRVRTPIAALISATIILISLNLLTGVFYFIPKASLSAVVMVAALNLIDWHIVPDIWKHCKGDCILLLITFLVCVFFEISYGVLFMLFINMLMLLKSVVDTGIEQERIALETHRKFTFGDATPLESVIVLRLSHGMRYPSVEKFLKKTEKVLRNEKHVIVDCIFVHSVDYTGVQAFRSLLLMSVKKGFHIAFVNMNQKVREQLEKLGLEKSHLAGNIDEAIGEYNKAVALSEMQTIPEDGAISAEQIARDELLKKLAVIPNINRDIPMVISGTIQYDDEENEFTTVGDEPDSDLELGSLPQSKVEQIGNTPKNWNVQFLNHVLLRELSRNSSKEHLPPTSRRTSVDVAVKNAKDIVLNRMSSEMNPQRFRSIGLSSPQKRSPQNSRRPSGNVNTAFENDDHSPSNIDIVDMITHIPPTEFVDLSRRSDSGDDDTKNQ